jgi:hypothetical protein
VVVAKSRYYPSIYLEAKITKTTISIASIPAEIRTEHHPNASLQRYRYGNPLGGLLCLACFFLLKKKIYEIATLSVSMFVSHFQFSNKLLCFHET